MFLGSEVTNKSVVEKHNSPEFSSESELVTSLDMAMAMGQQYTALDSSITERELKQTDIAIFNTVQIELMYALLYIIEIKRFKFGNSLKEHVELIGKYIENARDKLAEGKRLYNGHMWYAGFTYGTGVSHRFSKVIEADKLENFYLTNAADKYSNLEILRDWDEVVAEIQPIIESLCDTLGDNMVIARQNISLYLKLSE